MTTESCETKMIATAQITRNRTTKFDRARSQSACGHSTSQRKRFRKWSSPFNVWKIAHKRSYTFDRKTDGDHIDDRLLIQSSKTVLTTKRPLKYWPEYLTVNAGHTGSESLLQLKGFVTTTRRRYPKHWAAMTQNVHDIFNEKVKTLKQTKSWPRPTNWLTNNDLLNVCFQVKTK